MRWISADDRELRFWGETVVGRGRAGSVVDHRTVSAQHARVSYFDDAWHIRDLGSRNGTFVDGQRLEVGPWRRLEGGAKVELGGAPVFRIADVGAPTMHARSEAGVIVLPVDGVLALPSSDAPEVLVMEGDDGYVMERDGQELPIADGAEVETGGQRWRIMVGGVDAGLYETQPTAPARDVRAARFTFTESMEIGLVRLDIACEEGCVSISGRSFIVVLLHLARARLSDRKQAKDERQCGWRSRRDVLSALRITPEKLNLDLHRARRVLSAEGVRAVDALIERRRDSGMMRLGPGDVTIRPPAEPPLDDLEGA
jgi:pSer/pThr/pTyr-binding forkhead associated (FHA) protein